MLVYLTFFNLKFVCHKKIFIFNYYVRGLLSSHPSEMFVSETLTLKITLKSPFLF